MGQRVRFLYEISHLPVIGVGGPAPAAAPPPAAPPRQGALRLSDPAKSGPAVSGLRFTALAEVH